jgi:hypothetical protein
MGIHTTIKFFSKKIYLFIIVIFSLSHQVYGQEESTIETDRPDETEAASVVPVRTIQLESGFYFKKDGNRNQEFKMIQYPVLLVRVGVLDWLELRAESALQRNKTLIGTEDSDVNGLAPLTLGSKIALWQEKGLRPQAAFMVMVDMPIGSSELRPENPDPSLRLMFKNTLSERIDINYNVVYAWEGGIPAKGYAVSIGAALTEKLTIYAEAFGEKSKDEKAVHSTDGGLLFLVTPTLQLDLAVGTPFNSFGKNYFVTTGVSYRLPY